MTVRVAVVGAAGRMGSLVCRLVEQSDDFELAATIGSSGELSEMVGADVVVDFSVPAVSPEVVAFAVEHGLNILVGTSGWSANRLAPLASLLESHPGTGVIVVPNFSLGSVIATRLAMVAARYFDSIEIIETHGRSKLDSPSGTAVRTAELMADSRRDRGLVDAPHTDQRARGQLVAGIPVHSLRLQGAVAHQDVHFGGVGESLTIAHDTVSASAYESGILLALRALPAARGLTVGLDSLLGLDAVGGPDSPGEPAG
ncbi:4-hydroxy-tetrahydrodipicolinate reductase [Cryobacterium mesophilum]|uniref:4-hydroxy-tetrahydrodipicolinate reductase n=1 Tax=Terrimesophilobacter mesophilus TaxID=433647 RepID=A0A4R8VB03_9MICO|nr:4-hydroxy-tetrahydrodipicolinate reductase [Terrimesophilobacter mesophilus]MBB5632161.1 4-hydroxy-tetrahydrodipicolinate reductase [Terrimesophilobacter mesophilus]TFB79027.1 4-hydroxy-tetrahydrodipicolinate reductase [Terrimesophilobacter mesophilus]